MTELFLVLGQGMEMLQDLLHDAHPGAVEAARAVIRSLLEGHAGKVTPQALMDELEAVRRSLIAQDAAADAALKKKFDTGGE